MKMVKDMTITTMERQGDGIPDNPGEVLWQQAGKNWYGKKLQYQYWFISNTISSHLMVDYKSVVSKRQKHKLHYNLSYLLIKD
jgi:hypothetical protein